MALDKVRRVTEIDPETGKEKPVTGLYRQECGTYTVKSGAMTKTFPDFQYVADFVKDGQRFRRALCRESKFASEVVFDRKTGTWNNPAFERAKDMLEELRATPKKRQEELEEKRLKRAAEAAALAEEKRQREAAEEARRLAEENRPTISYLWRKYLAGNPDMKGITPDTNRFDHYLLADFGDKTPAEITELDLERLRLGMLRGKIGPTKQVKEGSTIKEVKTPKSAQTVKHVLVLLRRIIRYGVQHRLCPAPSLVFKMPKVDNQVTEHLTDAQVQALVAALEQEEDRAAVAVVKLAMLTGMRRGELLGLRWQNVDLDRALVRIDNPKGGKSQTIPISAAAVGVLREVAAMRDKALHDAEAMKQIKVTAKVAQRVERAAKRAGSVLVFPGKDGNPRTDLKRPLDRIRKAAGLPADFRPLHGLRHHFASTLASSGEVDLYVLQKLLTHKDPATTQRYAHLRDETLRSAADVAAKSLTAAIGAKPESQAQ